MRSQIHPQFCFPNLLSTISRFHSINSYLHVSHFRCLVYKCIPLWQERSLVRFRDLSWVYQWDTIHPNKVLLSLLENVVFWNAHWKFIITGGYNSLLGGTRSLGKAPNRNLDIRTRFRKHYSQDIVRSLYIFDFDALYSSLRNQKDIIK